jgi:putative transposase
MSTTQTPIVPGRYYHLYNHANEGFDLFRSKENYSFFLQKYKKYVHPIADTYSYCLMPNHFHFLIRMKTENDNNRLRDSESPQKVITNAIKNWLISYTKSYHRVYSTRGNLYYQKIRRKEVRDEEYLFTLISYIHMNPLKHRYVKTPEAWRFSSYNAYISDGKSMVNCEKVMKLFGGMENFSIYHDLKKAEIFAKENKLDY